jgi:outer membrane PBP1 activator LpoA protein
MVNGHRGTDHAADSTNRIRSDEHPDCTGVDTVYIAVTPEQFEVLAARVGAHVEVRRT